MSLFGCKDDSLLWFIILFILLFCTGNGRNNCDWGCGNSNENDCDCNCQRDCNRCLR